MNNRNVKVHHVDCIFDNTKWKNLKVGDVIKVEKDGFFSFRSYLTFVKL